MSEDLSKLGLVELLNLLEPIPEPAAVSLWPQTVAWLWIGVVLVLCGTWLGRRWVLHRQANAYRRAALRGIAAAGEDPAALAEILRRTAISAFPRAQVAGLYGEEWLAFLDRAYGGTEFSDGRGRVFAVAPYRPVVAATRLAQLAGEWVVGHRRDEARVR